jgi:hypothetical protein
MYGEKRKFSGESWYGRRSGEQDWLRGMSSGVEEAFRFKNIRLSGEVEKPNSGLGLGNPVAADTGRGMMGMLVFLGMHEEFIIPPSSRLGLGLLLNIAAPGEGLLLANAVRI